MPGAASTSTRNPLSELPLALFLPALTSDPERSPSSSGKGKEKERLDGGFGGRSTGSNEYKDHLRPGSPLKPRALLAPAGKPDPAGPSSLAGLMSPAKRRLLEGSPRSPRKSASMSSLRTAHSAATSSGSTLDKTPARRMMYLEDELTRGTATDEEGSQRAWEARSPARRLFMDGEAGVGRVAGSRAKPPGSPLATLAPRPMRNAGSPAFLGAAAPVSTDATDPAERGGAGLAPSPPIQDKATAAPGSPTTPRPSKRSRVGTGSPATALPTKTPATIAASLARSARRAPINLLDDLEDDVFSSPARPASKTPSKAGPSTPSSSHSRSTARATPTPTPTRRARALSFSDADGGVNGDADDMDYEISHAAAAATANIDVSHCGFEIWDDELERERERYDSARSASMAVGQTAPVVDTDGGDTEMDQENRPPPMPASAKVAPGGPLDRTDSAVHLGCDGESATSEDVTMG